MGPTAGAEGILLILSQRLSEEGGGFFWSITMEDFPYILLHVYRFVEMTQLHIWQA